MRRVASGAVAPHPAASILVELPHGLMSAKAVMAESFGTFL
jgi:hypothetical protein